MGPRALWCILQLMVTDEGHLCAFLPSFLMDVPDGMDYAYKGKRDRECWPADQDNLSIQMIPKSPIYS